MYRFVISFGYLLSSFFLSHARHTVFISRTGKKTFLPSPTEACVCTTPVCVIAASDILTSLDKTVDPCDDFYSFTCGNWMIKQDVSKEEEKVDNWRLTRKNMDRKLRDLVKSGYKSSDQPSMKLLKDFYDTCMDVDTIEKQGSELLKKMLRDLGGGWPVVEGSDWDESSFDWTDTLISLRKLGWNFEILLDLSQRTDHRNATKNILYLDINPDLETLVKTPQTSEEKVKVNVSLGLKDPTLAAYYAYYRMMVKAAKLLGADESTAEKEMLEVLNFYKDLLEISRVEWPIGQINETVITIAELQKELPKIPWLKIISGLVLVEQIDEKEPIIYSMPSSLAKFADLITSTDKRTIANYMMWWVVLESKEYLSEEWQEKFEEDIKPSKNFKMAKKDLRWKKCLNDIKINLEIPLSSYYVRNYFNDEIKDEAIILMNYIHKEFLKRLENNDWMNEKIREKAEEKAKAIKAHIGYPKELLNDTFVMEWLKNLTIKTDSYMENMLEVKKWTSDKKFSELRLSKDEIERRNSLKFRDIITVNAFYSMNENALTLPVGILQDAFYNKDKPKYMSFAEIGYFMGHEITHAFDNNGRFFDKDGKFIMWWDKETDRQFLKKAWCFVDQYSNYTTFIGMKIDGRRTMNENIADNGGIKAAYLAYQSWVEEHGTEPLLPGLDFTQNQIFWISAAQVKCSKYHPEKMRKLLVTGRHSPDAFRIIGSMSNLEEFSRDFKCSADAPMNRKNKCVVW